jgi:hypothetical protein
LPSGFRRRRAVILQPDIKPQWQYTRAAVTESPAQIAGLFIASTMFTEDDFDETR